ncbi:MAG TPA: class I SAM-dependent methyltransferase, partial [Ktedonobacteraceae bacterium]
DVLNGLPFPDRQFDYVHQRLLVAALPATHWPTVIHELVRVTRPGGWIELLEIGVTIQHAGPETTYLLNWMGERSRERGFDMGLLSRLGEMLAREGLETIERHDIPVPLGEWADMWEPCSKPMCSVPLRASKALIVPRQTCRWNNSRPWSTALPRNGK